MEGINLTNYIKSTLLLTILAVSLQAQEIEVVWKQRFNQDPIQNSENVMEDIHKDIALQINTYLKPRKAIKVSKLIPSEILEPVLPATIIAPEHVQKIKLQQNKYERLSEFKQRVEQQNRSYIEKSAQQKKSYEGQIERRNTEIEALSLQYKKAVKARNTELIKLQELVTQDIELIKKEQADKKKNLNKYIHVFVKNAFKHYLGSPSVIASNYTVNNETMQLTIASSNKSFKQSVEFSLDPHLAQEMDSDLSLIEPKLIYTLSSKPKENLLSIKLDSINLVFNNQQYLSKLSNKSNTQKYMVADIEIDDPTNVSLEDTKLDLQEESLAIVLQKSTLKDVSYRVTSESNNEILSRLKTLKSAKKDETKWLFVVGIEKYDNGVAPIAYSAQSAKSYSALAQKLLGIPKENSFDLINQKASSGKIKSEMKRMLSLVKKDDTIYFYYSGHGIPVAAQNNEPYMLPYDIDPSYIDDESFYKLKNFYKMLSDSKASKIVAVIDSCFSGSTDGESLLKGVAAARLVAKKVESFDTNKMVVLSAGQGKQYSNMYREKEQRLFSYFIMNSILENEKTINLLYKDVYYNVEKTSRKMGNLKLQQPTLSGNTQLNF